jgi:SAM-dependent methyltransferase
MHPWQEDESARRALIGMSRKKELAFLPWLRWAPPELQQPTLDDMQQAWDKNAELCDAKYGEYGDAYRQYIFNPALFPMLGELKGKRVLDAGCGAGYLSRLMTKQGAQVTGIDLSKKFIEIAKRYETQNLLGIKYEQGDIADLSQFRSESFDLAVSVYVLCDTLDCEKAIHEIARVLIPGGDFIFLIAHPCFEWQAGGWERIPKDSQRSEDRPYFKVDQYFRRGTLECQWGNLSPLLTFHRPLSDYFHFLNQSGFLVKDLVEPRPVREALKELPHYWENENRIPPVLIIHAIKSNS